VLGFLSVSTAYVPRLSRGVLSFQSRAGFSECLDPTVVGVLLAVEEFQSRAGFSECLDSPVSVPDRLTSPFQSRAGFSECLDQAAALCGTARR